MSAATLARQVSTTVTTPLAITACGVVSPAGFGAQTLAAALAATSAPSHYETEQAYPTAEHITTEDLPPREMRAAPPLPLEELLGRKGLRQLDRTTALGLTACALALGELAEPLEEQLRFRTGAIVGTNGSVRSSSEYSRETLIQTRPYLVNPSLFPNTVMNCAAGQIAIRNSFRGVNATLAGGALAGIQAFRYARNALARGYAEQLVVGAVEEFSPQAAWGWHNSSALQADSPVGEGSAMFLLEGPDTTRPVLAHVLASEVAYAGGARVSLIDTLTSVIRSALSRSGIDASTVTDVALGATGQIGLETIEIQAVKAALGDAVVQLLQPKLVTGETFSAGAALQLAALLGTWDLSGDVGDERVGLVTAISPDGNVGCVVVRSAAYFEGKSHVSAG